MPVHLLKLFMSTFPSSPYSPYSCRHLWPTVPERNQTAILFSQSATFTGINLLDNRRAENLQVVCGHIRSLNQMFYTSWIWYNTLCCFDSQFVILPNSRRYKVVTSLSAVYFLVDEFGDTSLSIFIQCSFISQLLK